MSVSGFLSVEFFSRDGLVLVGGVGTGAAPGMVLQVTTIFRKHRRKDELLMDEEYRLFDSGIEVHPSEMFRHQALLYYQLCMKSKAERQSQLTALLRSYGLQLDGSDQVLQQTNDWFRAVVEEDWQSPGQLAPFWQSVVHDLGLYLGDLLILRAPHLHWRLQTEANSDASYHSPVVAGFSGKQQNVRLDFRYMIECYAQQVLRAEDAVPPDRFVAALHEAEAKARDDAGSSAELAFHSWRRRLQIMTAAPTSRRQNL